MMRFLRTAGVLYVSFFFVTLLIYGRTLTAEFVTLDDGLLIYQNPTVQGITLRNIVRAFTTYDPELYIPLTFLTYQIDYVLGGIDPFFYHLQNLLWHSANAVLVFFLLRRILGPAQKGQDPSTPHAPPGVLTLSTLKFLTPALLFLVHPINTEAVAWAAARKDLVSTFFFLLSLLLYLQSGRRFYLASVGMFALALMGKVSAVTLPVVLVLVDWLRRPAQMGQDPSTPHAPPGVLTLSTLKFLTPYLALATLFGIIALVGKSGGHPTSFLLATASTIFSLQKFFLPLQLAVGYPFSGDITLASPKILLPFLGFLLYLTFTGICFLKRWRVPAFALSFFLLTLIPSLFNLSKGLINYLGADRYLYIPTIGLIILIAWLVAHIADRRPALTGTVVVLLLVTLSVMSYYQSLTWRTNEALYQNVIELYPDSSGARVNLGNAYRNAGRLADALAEYEEAIRLDQSPKAYYNRGITLEQLGRVDEAIASYSGALADDPTYALAHVNLGRLLYERQEKETALRHFEQAVEIAPHLALAHFNIGYIHAERGNFTAAIESYRKALDGDPGFIDARVNLVIALLRLERREDAQREYERLLREAPEHPSVFELQSVLR